MATTINGSTSSPAYWVFKIIVTENSTNIANNTSSVTVEAFIGRNPERETGSYLQRPEISCSIGITGCSNQTISYSNSGRIDLEPGQYFSIGKTTFSSVPHNDDGSKTVSVSASFVSDVSPTSGSASGTVSLTTIPRKSSLSVGNGTLGTAQTLTVSRQSSSFTHTIIAKCGSVSATICTKSSSASISFTPPLAWASQNTTGTSVSVTYTITTYNGSTSIGTNSHAVTCSIPSSVKPSVAITVTDAMGYLSTYGGYIKGYSKFKITLAPTTSYGSDIASYKIVANGSTYASSSVTTDAIKSSGTLTISASVTDKRGRSGSSSTTVTVLDYSAPKITLLKVNRCNSDGVENDQGEYVKVTYSGTVTSLYGKNTAKWVLYYKKSSDSSYTSVILSTGTTFTMSNATKIISAVSDSSYNIKLEVTDNLATTTSETVASTAFTMMNFNSAGNGMAIGKVAETEKLLDIGMSTKFNGDVYGTVMGMGYLPDIPDNADFNDYVIPGAYKISTYKKADTISNMPYTTAGRLKVEMSVGLSVDNALSTWSYILQTFYTIDGDKYTRHVYSQGTAGVWTYEPWKKHTSIIDEGTSGIWTYRKWSNGVAECWGRTTPVTVDINTAWGGIYTCDYAVQAVAYPFSFTSIPTVVVNPVANGIWNYWLFTCGRGSATISPSYGAARGYLISGVDVSADLYVIGKWK